VIAKQILDFIRVRTDKGKDKDNKDFVGYSDAYKRSRDFKTAHKTSRVNLKSTKEMMAELDLLRQVSGSITIGYDKEDIDLNGKVEGNRLGTYGNKKPVVKGRDFLGITDKDLKKVLKMFPLNNDKKREKNVFELVKAAAAAGEIIGGAATGTVVRNQG